MNIEKFLIKVEELFIEEKGSSEKYIIERLDIQRAKLITLINDLESNVDMYFSVKRDTIKNNVRDLYAEIIESIELFMNGQFDKSSLKMYDRFLNPNSKKRISVLRARRIGIENKLHKINNDNLESIDLFRVRENKTYRLHDENEMFHIPFEKRGLVTNQRYSMSGYPCLYLGSSIYGCWEATGRPNIDTFNVVSLRAKKELNLIDLRIPQLNNKLFFNEEYIYQLILPLVCSFKTRNSKDSFKPEYIIPQNILSGIIKRNHTDKKTDDVNWDGIMYTSNIYGQKECFFNDKNKLINIVIPIKSSKEKGLCQDLLDAFSMTKSTSTLTKRITDNIVDTFIPFEMTAARSSYDKTMWGELEDKIKTENYSEINVD